MFRLRWPFKRKRKSEGGPPGPPLPSEETSTKSPSKPEPAGKKYDPEEFRAKTAEKLAIYLFCLFSVVTIMLVVYAMAEPSDGQELIKIALPFVASPFLIALGFWFGRGA